MPFDDLQHFVQYLEQQGQLKRVRAEVDPELEVTEITVSSPADLTRNAGHSDILRDQVDGAAGMRVASTNLPDGVDWPAYVARLEAVADRFASD